MHILDLPDTVLMDILELLSYDEVAKKREVCTRFNYICQQVLNTGFNKIIQEHSKHFKRIKAMLPRRESERRNHCLARHTDILTSIETRISMLTMTYSKFIDLNICCFIPGRVLDEISNILKLLASATKPLRPHEVLQELRDISSMAIEHFDEKIAVNFKSDHRNKLVCTSLGEISFSGVKRAAAVASSSTHKEAPVRCNDAYIQQCNNVLYMTQKTAVMVQQARLMANPQPGNDERISGKPTRKERMFLHLKKQSQQQKSLAQKLRSLESLVNAQDRRHQEAISTITELTTQVSELKRQLEDVVTSKHTALSIENTASSSGNSGAAVKRQAVVAAECLPPLKKSKI